MFHRAMVRACHNATIQAAMRSLARALAPVRDAYSGGVDRDRDTLDVHRRQLDALRRRDREALDRVLDEHLRMLEDAFADAIGRDREKLFGADA
jgi:DNA-binding GntR family transcriptional regulator